MTGRKITEAERILGHIETHAGMLARTYPELSRRELSALGSESERTIRERAEDAQAQAWAVLHFGAGSNAYWAALS